MSVVDACPALRQKSRRDSACFAHVLGAIASEQLRVCRESCVYGRGLAMSAEVPFKWALPLPDFIPLEVNCGQEEQLGVRLARVGLGPVELLGRLVGAANRRGRTLGSKNAPKPVPVPTPAPQVPAFLVVSALAAAVASYPPQMKRTKALILRKRYNHAAGSGHKYQSYNDFLRDLNLAGVCVVRDKHRVQASWVMLDDAMQRLILTKQKRAA